MKATKDHISLETAKMLKDCGIESRDWYIKERLGKKAWVISDKENVGPNDYTEFYPAFSWQEILWEYHEQMFGEDNHTGVGLTFVSEYHARNIVSYLQMEEYEKADEYFRENCILINQ